MKLILAEKPSVAREIAKVIGANSRNNGYLQGNGYYVSWAIGHLVNIAMPEKQDKSWGGRWALDKLPMIPRKFKLELLKKTKKQFDIVKKLMATTTVDEIINATDAGREGELIFRRIYLQAGCKKKITRLWANDMTTKGLQKAMKNIMPGEEKRNLGLAAFARAEADWLVGMNFSRLFTLKKGSLVTVGRVQTPVLKLIVDRLREIQQFVPKDYWIIEATLGESEEPFKALWHKLPALKETKIFEKDDAQSLVEKCKGKKGKVEKVVKKKGRQKPPLPFDLTTLQREANVRYGFSAKQTLTITQDLYEKQKLVTYPRTDSKYLTDELFEDILEHMRGAYSEYPQIAKEAAQRVKDGNKFAAVNSKKVSDHHAIIPTSKKINRGVLSPKEWKIYDLISRRFFASFLPEAKFASSTLWIDIEGEKFKATGKIFEDIGWLKAEPWRASKDNPLPNVKEGSIVDNQLLESIKKITKAPPHYTDASLLGIMETAGKLIDDEELKEAMKGRGLGTPATRAQIIETLSFRKYISKEKKKLIATDAGVDVIRLVEKALPDIVSPEMTGDWEKKLKDIEMGSYTYSEFMGIIRRMVHENVFKIKG
jgi:DNA topoisomerase III